MTLQTFRWREQARRGDAIKTAFVALTLLAVSTSVVSACDAHAALNATRRMADAAQTPTADDTKPAESKPGGTRPTTPAPQPATPQDKAPSSEVPAALPPAPAEKTGPPINAK